MTGNGAASIAGVTPHDGVTPPVIRVRELSKQFGVIQALSGIDLDIEAGRVHGLVGANGAGKSTLVKILAGVEHPDSGTIELDGRAVHIGDVHQAHALGLSFIHQELNLVPKFTARQNMVLGLRTSGRLGLIDRRLVRAETDAVAQRLKMPFSLDVPVERLSVAARWEISIGRALVRRAKLIAMDEPTASLSSEEAEHLFEIVHELAAASMAVLYVSHRLDEIIRLCDIVTVFKDGRLAATMSPPEMTRATLVRAIVGREIASTPSRPRQGPQEVVLAVKDLRRGRTVRGMTFDVHSSEVVGLAGLAGSGRTETARMVFGADRPDGGEMYLDGVPIQPSDPTDAIGAGIALVPEERRSQGLFLKETITFNLTLPAWQRYRLVRWLPLVNRGAARKAAARTIASLGVQAKNEQVPVMQLSGGNQQKVVIGRWLGLASRVLILDEPTRGVDVGARGEIQALIRQLADEGRAILLISSEFDELLWCDRVLVVVEGRVAGQLVRDEITEEAMLRLCYAGQAGGSDG